LIDGKRPAPLAVIPCGHPADAALSPSALVGLIGAFGERDTKWSDLTSGVSLKMTPNVLRDTNTAELNFTLTTGPANIDDGTKDGGESPISRVNQHKVETTIYLKTLDLFTFSTFDNQSTKDGGRGYIPIVGKIWQGFFSDLPVVGNLFSWKKDPQNVYHQSVLLANTLITPTAMAIASVYDLKGEKTCMQLLPYNTKKPNSQQKQLDVDCLNDIVKRYKCQINPSNDNSCLDKRIPNEMIIKQNGVN
jgi:hypothetical protein